MKILWFISGNPLNNGASGWVSSAYTAYKESFPDDEIVMADMTAGQNEYACVSGIEVYSLKRDDQIGNEARRVLDIIKPDVITVFGTEYPYQCAVIDACCSKWADRTTVWIQGLISDYVNYYTTGVPSKYVLKKTLKERFAKRMNLAEQVNDFLKRGELEKETLKKAKHVLGRTEWDKQLTKEINPQLGYHYCNETLRGAFYQNGKIWAPENGIKHRIMVSSCSYPIKGFHFMLEAAGELIQEYPDLEIVCPGRDYVKWKGINKLRLSAYQEYLRSLVKKYNLEGHIRFVGKLSAEEMVETMLHVNVFVLCSTIENSSNALGEAMLLGMPIVAARVGGTETMIGEDESYLFDRGDVTALVDGIRKMFEDESCATSYASKAREHALKTHDPAKNADTLHKEYISIIENEN